MHHQKCTFLKKSKNQGQKKKVQFRHIWACFREARNPYFCSVLKAPKKGGSIKLFQSDGQGVQLRTRQHIYIYIYMHAGPCSKVPHDGKGLMFLSEYRKGWFWSGVVFSKFSSRGFRGSRGFLETLEFTVFWKGVVYKCSSLRDQKTVCLVNHASARVTPANFVVFVVSRWLRSKTLVLVVRTQIRPLAVFIENPLILSAFLKHAFREVTCGFCKGTVPGAPPLPSQAP